MSKDSQVEVFVKDFLKNYLTLTDRPQNSTFRLCVFTYSQNLNDSTFLLGLSITTGTIFYRHGHWWSPTVIGDHSRRPWFFQINWSTTTMAGHIKNHVRRSWLVTWPIKVGDHDSVMPLILPQTWFFICQNIVGDRVWSSYQSWLETMFRHMTRHGGRSRFAHLKNLGGRS